MLSLKLDTISHKFVNGAYCNKTRQSEHWYNQEF
jgi:hypothetical protein